MPSARVPPLIVVALVVLFEALCFTTSLPIINFYTEALGGDGVWIGLMFVAMTAPKLVSNPAWGALADRIGRRPVLAINTLGTLAGSIGWALSHNVAALLASRLAIGVFGAQAVIAQSVAADTTAPERRAASLGLLGAAFAVALTIGPLLGGWIGESWSLAAVGWVCAAFQVTSLALIALLLRETRPAGRESSGRAAGPANLSAILRDGRVRAIALLTLLVTLALSQLNSTFGLVLAEFHQLDRRQSGYTWAYFGLIAALSQGGLVRPLTPRLGDRRTALLGLFAGAAGFAGLALNPAMPQLLGSVGLVAVGAALTTPTLAAMLSQSVANTAQGAAMGVNQAVTSLGRALGAGLGGWLYELRQPAALPLPYGTSVFWLLLAGCFLALRRPGTAAPHAAPPAAGDAP